MPWRCQSLGTCISQNGGEQAEISARHARLNQGRPHFGHWQNGWFDVVFCASPASPRFEPRCPMQPAQPACSLSTAIKPEWLSGSLGPASMNSSPRSICRT